MKTKATAPIPLNTMVRRPSMSPLLSSIISDQERGGHSSLCRTRAAHDERDVPYEQSDEIEAQLAELLQAARDLVARFQPHLLFLRHAEDHTLRGAGEEDVARLYGHHLRGEADQLAAIEDHVVGVPILPLLAVDPCLEPQIIGIGDQVAR